MLLYNIGRIQIYSNLTAALIAAVLFLPACSTLPSSTPTPSPAPTLDTPPESPSCRVSEETSYSGPLTPTQAAAPAQPPPTPLPTPTALPPLPLHPRLGFGIASPADADAWAPQLGASWTLDWSVHFGSPEPAVEHWQMVRLTARPDGSICFYPSLEALAWQAARYPCQHWIIGNEPDVIWQDDLTPAQFAGGYARAWRAIKAADATALVGPGGVSQATPLRLEYLEHTLATYLKANGAPLPADFWTVHGFILREEQDSWGVEIPPGMDGVTQDQLYEVEDHDRMDLFTGQIEAFRAWMAAYGYRDRPLALTEFGMLMPADYGFPPERTAAFLKASFIWLDTASDPETGYPADGDRLVQRWAWFSLSDPLYPASNLADLPSGKLTGLGQAYRAWREASPD